MHGSWLQRSSRPPNGRHFLSLPHGPAGAAPCGLRGRPRGRPHGCHGSNGARPPCTGVTGATGAVGWPCRGAGPLPVPLGPQGEGHTGAQIRKAEAHGAGEASPKIQTWWAFRVWHWCFYWISVLRSKFPTSERWSDHSLRPAWQWQEWIYSFSGAELGSEAWMEDWAVLVWAQGRPVDLAATWKEDAEELSWLGLSVNWGWSLDLRALPARGWLLGWDGLGADPEASWEVCWGWQPAESHHRSIQLHCRTSGPGKRVLRDRAGEWLHDAAPAVCQEVPGLCLGGGSSHQGISDCRCAAQLVWHAGFSPLV